MGKGDIKTKRGKMINGSFGVRRPKKTVPLYVAPAEKPADEKPAAKEKKTK